MSGACIYLHAGLQAECKLTAAQTEMSRDKQWRPAMTLLQHGSSVEAWRGVARRAEAGRSWRGGLACLPPADLGGPRLFARELGPLGGPTDCIHNWKASRGFEGKGGGGHANTPFRAPS